MKKVLFASSECVPFIKTGGLADVVGSLPKCFDKRYYDVRVILPKYSCMKRAVFDMVLGQHALKALAVWSVPLHHDQFTA